MTELVRALLAPGAAAQHLRAELSEWTAIVAAAARLGSRAHAQAGTATVNGLALAPGLAASCADDALRTLSFVRGAHEAILGLRERRPGRPVRVLYAGCGPYATLALPLMAVLGGDVARFTLLDLHAASIASADALLAELGLRSSVDRLEVGDAADWQATAGAEPDLILLETLQACLEAEPQVALSRHLMRQAPHALLVPEEIRVELRLCNPAQEFAARGMPGIHCAAPWRRALGTVFVLDRAAIRRWAEAELGADDRLPAASLYWPADAPADAQPFLFTEIRCYGEHRLLAHDSGLTCPMPPRVRGQMQPGRYLHFHYQLGRHPGLRAASSNEAAANS